MSDAAPFVPFPAAPLAQADLLALFDRLLPPHYLVPLKNPGPGYELLQAYARLYAYAAEAVERMGGGSYLLSALSGSKATGTVELFRGGSNVLGITVVVKAGTRVKTSATGRRYFTIADVTFTSAALGPFSVGVIAEANGAEYNVPGPVTAADGEVLPGEIDTIDVLVESPDLGDTTIEVRQTVACTGGTDKSIDQLGEDRGLPRNPGESDTTYRARVRALPDNISPDAFFRTLLRVFVPLGETADFIELWDIAFQTCWNAPDEVIAGSAFDPNLFVYNDPRDPLPFRNRWLDENTVNGAFIVVVPDLPAMLEWGGAWSDPGLTPANFETTLGRWAAFAWNASDTIGGGQVPAVWNGIDQQKAAVYKGLSDTIDSSKAAGVYASVELEGE